MKVLDLFCCEGGASMGLHRAGFDVTGVDIMPRPNYPFRFIQADALTFDLSGFDFIWASPPCQFNLKGLNAANTARGRTVEHTDLIEPIRKRLDETGKPYIIENVEGAKLINPIRLCGSSFGLPIRRHRLFESNYLLLGLPCDHTWQTEKKYPTNFRPNGRIVKSTVVQIYGNTAGSHLWSDALGIDWMTREGLQQAIPPVYAKYLVEQIFPKKENIKLSKTFGIAPLSATRPNTT
jgi:DNA (cytosine-5)-methyltransferase 1